MINYIEKQEYIAVRWKRTEIGRIYDEEDGWVYRPRGCGGRLSSDHCTKLQNLKDWLEGR